MVQWWPWFPPPWACAASVLHPGSVALKFNSKRGNLVPPLVHAAGYRAQARIITPFDGSRWEAQGGLPGSLQPSHGWFSPSPFETYVSPDPVGKVAGVKHCAQAN